MDSKSKILFKEESYQIIGACMKVPRILGAGFLESVYEEALEKEFLKEDIEFERQLKLPVYYENQPLKKFFKADFICFNKIIIEIKAVNQMPMIFNKQLKNYLSATNYRLGILINFRQSSLAYKRIVN